MKKKKKKNRQRYYGKKHLSLTHVGEELGHLVWTALLTSGEDL